MGEKRGEGKKGGEKGKNKGGEKKFFFKKEQSMCTANRPKPCQANLLSDRLPEIKTPDSAGPVTGGSAYEAGKRKAPRSRCFVKKPSRHQPRLPPPPAAIKRGVQRCCPSRFWFGSRFWSWIAASRKCLNTREK